MATKDPKFVKLAPPWQGKILANLPSGWSISGLGVKPFPKNPTAAKYVRNMLQAARLVPATAAEYDIIQEQADFARDEADKAASSGNGVQEAILQERAQKVRESIRDSFDGEDFELPGDGDDEEGDASEESESSLMKLGRDELVALAAERGVSHEENAVKRDIAKAILAA